MEDKTDMIVNNPAIIGAFVKEIYRMLDTISRVLARLGITVIVNKGPLTDDEWDRVKVLPLYREWLKNGGDEGEEYLSPDDVEAFRRGEIPFSAITTKAKTV